MSYIGLYRSNKLHVNYQTML